MARTLTYPAPESFEISLFRTSGLAVVVYLAGDACFCARSTLGTLSIAWCLFVSSRPKMGANNTERRGLNPVL